MSLENEGNMHDDDTNYTILELLLSRTHRLALFVGMCLHFSKSLTGYAALRCYSTTFFTSAGFASQISEYLTIAMSVLAVIAVIASIPLMDRAGRRTLQLTGLSGVAFSFIMMTVGLNEDNTEAEILVALFAMLFMVFL